MPTTRLILRFRLAMAFFIFGLVLSGITAFSLKWEVDRIASWMGVGADANLGALHGLAYWIAYVQEGLHRSYDAYPFLAYGTDWLAFAHLAIAVFFIGPLLKPIEYGDWILVSGVIACVGVIPLALICGPLRGIPLCWRFIDCSFGIFGALPLIYCLALSRRIRRVNSTASPPR